jgi:2,3-bisphosphoglycerate-dependent phosphoglycerate mutase
VMPNIGKLVLLRHCESIWNKEDRFAGWVDIPLSDRGRAEARQCGDALVRAGLRPDAVHTSMLSRAISTAEIALRAAARDFIDVQTSWRLNERHYGALQGESKEQIRATFGDAEFMRWRRAYQARPPAIDPSSAHSQAGDPRYHDVGVTPPATESLADVLDRLLPYWHSAIVPDLRSGGCVLVVAHSNSLRALIKHLDTISDSDIAKLNIPTGTPIRYELDDDLNPLKSGGYRISDHPNSVSPSR